MLFVVCWYFSKSNFPKNSFRNTIRVSNSLDPHQALQFVVSDPCPNCLQKLSADDASRQKIKHSQLLAFEALNPKKTSILTKELVQCWYSLVDKSHGWTQRGETGGPPLKNYKNIGFLSNTGPEPLKTNPIQCWAIIDPPAKRHLNCVSLAGRWWPTFSGIQILPPLLSEKRNKKKRCQRWTPSGNFFFGSAHESSFFYQT